MNNFKLRVVAMPLTALLALAGCEKVDKESGDGKAAIAGSAGISDTWGDDARGCAPSGCAPKPDQRGGHPTGANIYHPEYLGLIHVVLGAPGTTGSNDDIRAKHALYEFAKCPATIDNKPIHQAILDRYESSGKWFGNDQSENDCKPISVGTGENMLGIRYFGQTDIYIDVDGLQSKFDPVHPIIFTKYAAGDLREKMTKNFSFYEAQPVKNGADELIYLKNYFSHKKRSGSWKPLKKPRDRTNPRDTKKYSMNIHLRSGSGEIPIIIDPDTGNGNDG